MSSLPRCLVYSLDDLSNWSELLDLLSTLSCFRLCLVNNSARYLDKLTWFVEYFSIPCKQLVIYRSLCWQPFLICRVLVCLLLCHVNNSLYVDLCVDNLSWSIECLSGLLLCHVNNLLYVDLCVLGYLHCSPRASCYLEQVAGGSCLEIALVYGQAKFQSFCFLFRVLAR